MSLLRGGDLPPESYLEPVKPAAWWKVGESIEYRLAGAPLGDEVTSIRGVVSDAWEKKVAEIEVGRSDIGKGWIWHPSKPGYYEVEFFTNDKNGNSVELVHSYRLKAPNGATRDFHREKQGFAVLPNKAFPKESTHQFGFDTYSSNAEDLRLAQLIGFDFVRLTAHWGPDGCGMAADDPIEVTKGTYYWGGFDRSVKMYSDAGFSIYGQLYGTPYWASPHPEKAGVINICVDQATAYAPKDMTDWSRFVEAIVTRYKDRIHLWEIWNEPSMPGGSVFWYDTPENFVKMLQSGYETIKKIQPESEVWIGGLGQTPFYYAFYDKVLSLGGGNSFDGLSLHGAWNSPQEKFRDIEKLWKVDPKPSFNTEWHAILQGNMQASPILSEKALAFRMMSGLMFQLKQGMSRSLLFEIKNLTEKEAILFAIDNKWFTHSSGFFRRAPQIEPRLPAVVMANFLLMSGRKAVCEKECSLSDDAIALSLATANGPVLVFWSDKVPFTTDTIRGFATAQSSLSDWEGKSLSLAPNQKLENSRIYYLSAPNLKKVADAPTTDLLISPSMAERRSQPSPSAVITNGRLFDAVEGPAHFPENVWITNDWRQTTLINGKEKAAPFSARAAFGATPEGLDVVIEVKDSVHFQKETSAFWNGDSVQLAFDCENSGVPGGNTELVAALTDHGPVVSKIFAAEPHGNIPGRWSPGNGLANYVDASIVHDGDTTRYQLRIPYSELYPLIYAADKPLHVAVVVNNNDGNGRSAYLEWASGIAKSKDSEMYGSLKPAPANAGTQSGK